MNASIPAKNGINPLLQADFYKTGHPFQYPRGTNKILANFTPRSARLAPVLPELFDNKIVWFGLQGFIKEILIDLFNREFFGKPAGAAVRQYQRRVDNALGKGAVTVDHLQALYDLGYLPLEIRSRPKAPGSTFACRPSPSSTPGRNSPGWSPTSKRCSAANRGSRPPWPPSPSNTASS